MFSLVREDLVGDLGTPASPVGVADGGFNNDNASRNHYLVKEKGMREPISLKTGTTLAGCLFKDGVVLGADTRATEGPIVADPNCEKIHYIADNIRCCGAGTAADTEKVTEMVSSDVELHRLATGRQPRVATALTLLKSHLFGYQGHVSAALILGGVDCKGPYLCTIFPHGSTHSQSFCTMGSGSMAAMAQFEGSWRPDMSRQEAQDLVERAILSGIENDLGSGSNVDLCVITAQSTDMLRNHVVANARTFRNPDGYDLPPGTTTVLSEHRIALNPGKIRVN